MLEVRAVNPREYEWPAIDIKLKNTGGEVGILTKAAIEIIECKPIEKVKLYYQLITNDDGDLIFRILNLGWGKAYNVSIDILGGQIREILKLNSNDYIWEGTIDECVDILIPSSKIKVKKETIIDGKKIKGKCEFIDSAGEWFTENIVVDGPPRYPCTGWGLKINDNKFSLVSYRPDMLFSLLIPSATYDLIIKKDNVITAYEILLSQCIQPNEADRFQIVIASEIPADYKLKCKILLDGTEWIDLGIIDVKIDFDRYLTNHGYQHGLSSDFQTMSLLRIADEEMTYLKNYKKTNLDFFRNFQK